MMKKIYITLLLLFCLLNLKAQQVGIYNHEFYNPMISNPAFTGNSEFTNAMLISRSQWIDFKNAPRMNLFTLDGMLPDKKMGLGIDLFSDKKGISNKIGGDIYYSYWLKLNDNAKLKFGIAIGMMDHTLQYSQAVLENPSDPTIVGTSQRETTINANVGIGFVWKKLETGFSVPQLLGNALEYQDNEMGKAYYALARHYQGSLKYKFMLSEDKKISLTPLAIVHFLPNVPIQYDANLNLEWKDKFWIGATYKSDYAVAANVGFCISKQFYVGYSYDFITGSIGKYSGMSHELMLNFVFGKSKHQNEIVPAVSALSSKDKEKADSLQTELEIKDNKIRTKEVQVQELNKEVDKLKTDNENLKRISVQKNDSSQIQSKQNPVVQNPIVQNPTIKSSGKQNPVVQNPTTNSVGEDKIIVDGVPVITANRTEFTYLNGKAALRGYYVMAGTFFYRDFALGELKKTRTKGFSSADILYSASRQYNYVTAFFSFNKEDALKQLRKIKAEGFQDAWILSLKE